MLRIAATVYIGIQVSKKVVSPFCSQIIMLSLIRRPLAKPISGPKGNAILARVKLKCLLVARLVVEHSEI